MRINSNGLKDLANAMKNIYPENAILEMPIWKGGDGLLYFQMAKGSGFIKLVKAKQEIKGLG